MLTEKDKNQMISRVAQDVLMSLDEITRIINKAPRTELIEFLQGNNINIEDQKLKITNLPASLSESDKILISEYSNIINILLKPREHQSDFAEMNISSLAITALVAEREEYANFITPIAAGYVLSSAINRLTDYSLVRLPGLIERRKNIELPVCYEPAAFMEPRLDGIRQMGRAVEQRQKREERIARLEAIDARDNGAVDEAVDIRAREERPKAAATEQSRISQEAGLSEQKRSWTKRTELPPIIGKGGSMGKF